VKTILRSLILTTLLFLIIKPSIAGDYYVLCEGNFGQANSSLWSLDESLATLDGPLIWDTGSNPLGDVGQSFSLYDHKLYIIMNNSHKVRVLDLENGPSQLEDIDLAGASPRYMKIQRSPERGFISSWSLEALLIIDLTTNTVVDTFLMAGLPEELLIDGDQLFVSMNIQADYSSDNRVIQLDISSPTPEVIETYEVTPGPGSMALSNNNLYVTSVYYNDAWEIFTGTSRIDLQTGAILAVDQGTYNSDRVDIAIINDVPHRTYASSIVPLDSDLNLVTDQAIAHTDDFISFNVQNGSIIVGSSDYVAPDILEIYSLDGQSLSSFTVGALPDDVVFYDANVVALDDAPELPSSNALGNAFPNPFNPSTSIPFQLEEAGQTTLRLYNAQGQLVTTLMNSALEQGNYTLTWNGTNDLGRGVPSGIYFAFLSTGSTKSVIKLNLIK